jgi:plastocyanin
MRRFVLALAVVTLVAAVAGHWAGSRAQVGERRHFTVLAVEPRGGTNVAQEPAPRAPLPAGGGYVYRAPDATGRWEVSTYVWAPAQIIVRQGDVVVIDFAGINGAEHPTQIGGEVSSFEFRADAPGVFPIICSTHQPSMRAEIVVLPRG